MLVKVTLNVTTQTLQNTDNHKSYSGKSTMYTVSVEDIHVSKQKMINHAQ